MTKRFMTLVAVTVLVAAGAAAGERGTADEAKALLDKAVTAVETEGSEKAVAAFNDPDGGFRDRDLYVFCMDGSNVITAHPDASLRGTDASVLKDTSGKAFGAEMVEVAKKGGGSVEYMWKNPVSGEVEAKVSFLKKAGDQYCGVGAYK